MAVGIDEYKKLKTKDKDRLFSELFELKAEKKILDDKIKELESQYKPDLVNMKNDVFYELDNGLRFSIKKSIRKGGYNAKQLDGLFKDLDYESCDYKNKDTDVFTLRLDK